MCKRDEYKYQIEVELKLLLKYLIEQYYKFYGQDNGSFSNVTHIKSSSTIDDNLDYEDFDITLDQYLEEQNNLIFGSKVGRYM